MDRMSITSSTLALGFVLAATGCSSTVTGTGTSGTSGTSGTTPAGGAESRCVGKAIEAYKAGDRETCSRQGSDWNSTSLTCRGTTFVVNCARGDGTGPDEAQKGECLDILGCSWTEPDGTIVAPSGHCDGTKQKCSTFATDETCRKQPGCIFYSSGGCEDLNGFSYLDNVDCSSLNFGGTLSVSVARSQCKRTLGCTWSE
jgi:hypothetical protein